MINTLKEQHPIHIHLINFQVYKKFTLKATPSGCSFYEIEWLTLSGVPQFQGMTKEQLCDYLSSLRNKTSQINMTIYDQFNKYNL